MAKVIEKIEQNEISFSGNVVDVCKLLEEESVKNKGYKLAQYLRLRKLQREVEKQFGERIWS